jgi:hypothetical protein
VLNYFQKVAKRAQEIHTMAYAAAQPLFKIQNRAYEVWWEGLKYNFQHSLVQFMLNGGKLIRSRIKSFDKEFQRHLKNQRCTSFHGYRKVSDLIRLTYEGNREEELKKSILFSYGEVVDLYTKAIKACRFEEDKKYLRKDLEKYEYIIRVINNTDGLADKIKERQDKKRKREREKRLLQLGS